MLANLGTKVFIYKYNFANSITQENFQIDQSREKKRIVNAYDQANRLSDVFVRVESDEVEVLEENDDVYEEVDTNSEFFFPFVNYEYNANLQIYKIKKNDHAIQTNFTYNNRNWIDNIYNLNEIFSYNLTYYLNGNINTQELFGTFNSNYTGGKKIFSEFLYDSNNRLIKTKKINATDIFDMDVTNSYDKDGNLLSMVRNFNSDNFSYNYYAGTNRLKNISIAGIQFEYDPSGNLISDSYNKNFDMIYDYRHLLIEVRSIRSTDTLDITFYTRYWYDEKGNRIRKLVLKSNAHSPVYPNWSEFEIIDPNNLPQLEDPGAITDKWIKFNDIFYVRNVAGKVITVYSNNLIDEWNVFGLGNEGRIKQTGEKRFYLKDHLVNIRVELNENNEVNNSTDYDPWGLIIREYQTGSKYKFSEKERDLETGYDYFGTRYYDSRIGRWGQMEPKYDKYLNFTPYNYAINNPLKYIDINGNDPFTIIITTFIPADIVFGSFAGDSRGFSHDPNASYRTKQTITVESSAKNSDELIKSYNSDLSPSVLAFGNYVVAGKGEGIFIYDVSKTNVSQDNISVNLIGTAHVGVIPTFLGPSIDYNVHVDISIVSGVPNINIRNESNGFPAYQVDVLDKDGKLVGNLNSSLPTGVILDPFMLIDNNKSDQDNNNSGDAREAIPATDINLDIP
ncbi:hypothetical protein BH10BAC5_BH10BAC5_02570 [soil metagenome]